MNAKSFGLSVQGASHIKKNKECQDHSGYYSDENCVVAIVCDGHGGDDYMRSAKGSRFACDVAEVEIREFLEVIDIEQFFIKPERYMHDLEASIINKWNNAVGEDFKSYPFTPEELSGVSEKARKRYLQGERIESAYGTTLIAVAMTKEFWFGMHIGDGKCVAINRDGEFSEPIPWDPKCFLNATTSICDSNAIEEFRHFYSRELPAAVFVGSDGIDDCFKDTEQFHNFYKTVLYSLGTSDFDSSIAELKDYLPRLSEKGSRDDMSIAAILDMDLVPNLEIVKGFDKEKEKARIAENARIEAEKMERERLRMEEEQRKYREEQKRIAEREKQRRLAAEQRQREERERIRKQRIDKIYREVPSGKQNFCTNCGNRISEEMRFCGNCGAKISWFSGIQKSEIINTEPELKAVDMEPAKNMEPVKDVESVENAEPVKKEKAAQTETAIEIKEPLPTVDEKAAEPAETDEKEEIGSVQDENTNDNNIEEANDIEVKDDLQNSDI